MNRIEAFGQVDVTSPDGDSIRLRATGATVRAEIDSWRSLRRVRARLDHLRPLSLGKSELKGTAALAMEVAVDGHVVAKGRESGGGLSWKPRWRGIIASALPRRER